jgi:hypothetical protein
MYESKVYIKKGETVSNDITVNKPLAAQASRGPKESFAPGDRVKHITFGEGEILSVEINIACNLDLHRISLSQLEFFLLFVVIIPKRNETTRGVDN